MANKITFEGTIFHACRGEHGGLEIDFAETELSSPIQPDKFDPVKSEKLRDFIDDLYHDFADKKIRVTVELIEG